MTWHSITKSIMHISSRTMGEMVTITLRNDATQTVMAIYEEATNFDETDLLANIENFTAIVDFKQQDLVMAPKKNDLVQIPRTAKAYKVIYVVDDGWARYRCYLKEHV